METSTIFYATVVTGKCISMSNYGNTVIVPWHMLPPAQMKAVLETIVNDSDCLNYKKTFPNQKRIKVTGDSTL